MGPFSYDLASLLYDPYAALSDSLIAELYGYYIVSFKAAIESKDICLAPGVATDEEPLDAKFETLKADKFDNAEFRQEFELMTLQRMLKAVGTYTYQQGACGNDVYVPYIAPALTAVRQSLEALGQFPSLRSFIG